ncbi:putative DNA primase/helicase [Chryseobacterium carnipullorum]|uniref:DNA primase family protein n=1 Tax=Chryseobacterium carnipullorum TaxID=1124835 RepID=UPI0009141DDD|nr:phage/plasmid primase, P4 family [Chryseobacterium carnipullorum]SHL52605.1 putative DNA primase/helicase [Chryseobacterium carnipullorum]
MSLPVLDLIKPVIQAAKELDQTEVLNNVKKSLQPADFIAEVHPSVIELRKQYNQADSEEEKSKISEKLSKFKLQQKNYIVIATEKILQLAETLKLDFCLHNNIVYTYNGVYWQSLEDNELERFLGDCAKVLGVPKYDASYFDFRKKMLQQFFSVAYLPKPETKTESVLINLQNGTLEISEKGVNLREHQPKDFLTYVLPFCYDPTAVAPLFNSFLDEVLSKQKQTVISEYLGYIFMRHGSGLKLEKVLLCYGTGANGKSVFFDIVTALLGDHNVSNFSLSSLTNENGYYRAKIANKLLNYSSEINNNIEAAIFKQLASGEPIEARLPYGDPITVKNYAKLMFNTNGFLVGEQTNAFFRRFLIIHFDKTISEENQDPELSKKIINRELSGVLNWALKGLTSLLVNKEFTPSEEIKQTLNEYRTQSDPVQMFILENYLKPGTRPEPLKDLYKAFKEFSEENGNRVLSAKTFADRLRMVGFETERRSIGNVVYVDDVSK